MSITTALPPTPARTAALHQTFARRRLLALIGGAAFAALPTKAFAGPAAVPIHIQLGQRTGSFATLPPGSQVVAWPVTDDVFTDPRGLVSADRTEIRLADPGLYLITWTATFEPGSGAERGLGSERATSLESAGADGEWHAAGDGNEGPPCSGGWETTLTGLAWVQSDGSRRVRVRARHDAHKPLRISDRNYEMHFDACWVRA